MRWAWVLLAACSLEHGGSPAPAGADAANQTTDATGSGSGSGSGSGTPDAATPAATIFTADANTLALFELNGSLADSSGNNRDATLIGGSFVPTAWGMGFSLPGAQTQGFQWNAYASLLVHPYTVEMVVTPASVSCWKKLFGPTDSGDAGWYYCGGLQSWPQQSFGSFSANQRHYIAIVSQSSTSIRAYVNGNSMGTTSNFTMPPASAIFFRDDTNTNRTEEVNGVVDAVRISKVARTPSELQAVQARLATQP